MQIDVIQAKQCEIFIFSLYAIWGKRLSFRNPNDDAMAKVKCTWI